MKGPNNPPLNSEMPPPLRGRSFTVLLLVPALIADSVTAAVLPHDAIFLMRERGTLQHTIFAQQAVVPALEPAFRWLRSFDRSGSIKRIQETSLLLSDPRVHVTILSLTLLASLVWPDYFRHLVGSMTAAMIPGSLYLSESPEPHDLETFLERYPKLEYSLGRQFIADHWKDFLKLQTAVTEGHWYSNTPATELFEQGLSELKLAFGEEWIETHWPDLVMLGIAAGKKSARLYGLKQYAWNPEGLPALKRAFGNQWIDQRWPELVELGIKAGEDNGHLFGYVIPYLHGSWSVDGRLFENRFTIPWINKRWPDIFRLAQAAERKSNDAVYAFVSLYIMYGPKWIDSHWEDLIALGVGAGPLAGDLLSRTGLTGLVTPFGVKWVDAHWPTLVAAGLLAKDQAAALFCALPHIKSVLTEANLSTRMDEIRLLNHAVGEKARWFWPAFDYYLKQIYGDSWIAQNWQSLLALGCFAGSYTPTLFQ